MTTHTQTDTCRIHTVRRDDTWINEIEGEGDVTTHATKGEAVPVGCGLAIAFGAEHVIHDGDGSVAARTPAPTVSDAAGADSDNGASSPSALAAARAPVATTMAPPADRSSAGRTLAVHADPFQPPGAAGVLGSTSGFRPPGGPGPRIDVYSDAVDLNEVLTPDQHEAYKRHTLRPGMPTWAFVVLSIITVGIFPSVYLQLEQGKLPIVKRNDPGAAKAVGFLFIPLFNLYWLFVVWRRLADRINFQYRLRGQRAPINRGHVTTAQALALFGSPLPIVALAGSVWLVVLAARFHAASNRLAQERVDGTLAPAELTDRGR